MPCVICGQWTPCPIWETISGNGRPYTRITEADRDSWVMGMYVDHQLIMWNIVCPVCWWQIFGTIHQHSSVSDPEQGTKWLAGTVPSKSQ